MSRILLGCSLGGSGHLLPVTTVAHALERLGHEPLLLVPPSLAARARESGVATTVGDQPPAAFIDAVWERVRRGTPEAVAGLIDLEVFAGRGAEAMLPAARQAVAEFGPDLVIREPAEFATAVAAHEAGVRQAQVAISQAGIEAGVLNRVEHIIDSYTPGLGAQIRASPYLTHFPAALDPSPWADTRRYRDVMGGVEDLPDWWPGHDGPLIYLTFGSVFGRLPEAATVYASAIEAVAPLPARILLTLGTEPPFPTDLPPNVHATRWVPQDAVLPHCQLVVCHGGSGTVCGALAHGVPVVVCPFFADQSANGRLVEGAGAGRLGAATDPGGLRAIVRGMLSDSAAADAARRIAAQMAATPSLDAVVAGLAT